MRITYIFHLFIFPGNGVASQEKPCEKTISLEPLRPQQPQQCDLAYEYGEFQMRCIPGNIMVFFFKS